MQQIKNVSATAISEAVSFFTSVCCHTSKLVPIKFSSILSMPNCANI